MNYTEHLELNKPERAEQFNIDHWNDNSDKIDSAIHNEVTRATGVETDLQAQIDQNRNEERRIGIVPISKGGTGNTTAQDALNALHGNVATQASINADDEITFIRRTPADLSLERPESIDVKDATLETIANKVFDLLKVNSANLFSATNNGFVPKANNAGAASYLSATGDWSNPSFSEDKYEVTLSRSFTIESNAILHFTASETVTIVLDDCEKLGCTVTIINSSSTITHSLSCRSPSDMVVLSILPNAFFKIAWNGSAWINLTAPWGTFTQYPNQSAPSVVYPCSKWEEVNYNGAFFRAEGGNAQAFDNQTTAQSDMIKTHTHTFTPAGSVSVKTNPTFTGSAVNTGAMSGNATGSISYKQFKLFPGSNDGTNPTATGNISLSYGSTMDVGINGNWNNGPTKIAINVAHTHSVTAKGSVSGGAYTFTGTAGITGSNNTNNTETRPSNYTMIVWKRIA